MTNYESGLHMRRDTMEEDYRKYMEGNYDGDSKQQYKQMKDDKRQAKRIAEEIKTVQEAILESETERLSYEYKVENKEFEELIKSYNQEDKYKEYLVDGAILRCNQATTNDFPYGEEAGTSDEDQKVVLVNKNEEECCNIVLNVSENPISINKLRYATVKDTLINVNIIPPKCNCNLAVNRNAERRKIREDSKRNENGVCMHLIRLNEEWDNLEVDGKSYLKK